MISKVHTYGIHGVESFRVTAEVDVSDGLPGFSMVGYLSEETREAQERVRTALRNAGFAIPPRKITVNLSPAGIRKGGTAYDCAIAVGILAALGVLNPEKPEPYAFFGELGLDGSLRPVRGILPGTLQASADGFQAVFLPKENLREGTLAENIAVIGASDIREVINILRRDNPLTAAAEGIEYSREPEDAGPDFSDLQGLPSVRLASMAAAAGGHNLLFIGPAGTGKTMAARRLPSILPPMSRDESLEVSKLYSICGMLDPDAPLITKRPFRSPHHSITKAALIGGGSRPQPGEVSLASGGVLFLDELPEFPARILDLLRQPVEEGKVTVNRVSGTEQYPADFLLVCAMNPCKCGFYPDMGKCRCSVWQRRRYLAGISGPFLDRIDIGVEVPLQKIALPGKRKPGESSASMREKVLQAREWQKKRFSGLPIRRNGQMTGKMLEEFCALGKEEESFLLQYLGAHSASLRGTDKLLRLARTLADLGQHERIRVSDLAQAAAFRAFLGYYWRREEL